MEDGSLLSDQEIDLFDFALGLRSGSAKIAANSQYFFQKISSLPFFSQECENYIIFRDMKFCSVAEVIESEAETKQECTASFLSIDHVFQFQVESNWKQKDVENLFLYGDFQSASFFQLYSDLKEQAQEKPWNFCLRFLPISSIDSEPLFLTGYGIELRLKRTDYIVIDDREKSDNADSVYIDQSEQNKISPLSKNDLQHLDLKAAQYLMDSKQPFEDLARITGSFPIAASQLSKWNFTRNLYESIKENQMKIPSGANVAWFNGIQLKNLDSFAALRLIFQETEIMNQMGQFGISPSQSRELLNNPLLKNIDEALVNQRYEYRDEEEEGKAIIWLNNIEKDKRYSSWPSDLKSLLRNSYPGQIPPIRRNINTAVLPLDLTNENDVSILIRDLRILVTRSAPVRFGIVPVVKDERSKILSKIAYSIVDSYGLAAMLSFFEGLEKIPKAELSDLFNSVTSRSKLINEQKELIYTELEKKTTQYLLEPSIRWCERLGIELDDPKVLVNGKFVDRDESWTTTLSQNIFTDLQKIQQSVYYGKLVEGMDITDFLLENALTKRNPLLSSSYDSLKFINIKPILDVIEDHVPSASLRGVDSNVADTGMIVFLIGDFDDVETCSWALKMGEYEFPSDTKLYLIHNPAEFVDSSFCGKIDNLTGKPKNFDFLETQFDKVKCPPKLIEASNLILAATSLKRGDRMIIVNGRVVGPLVSQSDREFENSVEIIEHELFKRVQTIAKICQEEKIVSPSKGSFYSLLSSAISSLNNPKSRKYVFEQSDRNKVYEELKDNGISVSCGDHENSMFSLIVVADPLTETSQKWSLLLKQFCSMRGFHVKVILNPSLDLDEAPITRFYNWSSPSLSFDDSGHLKKPKAIINGFTQSDLYVAGIDSPDSWIVMTEECSFDPDNVQFSRISHLFQGNEADILYKLSHILIDGHAQDLTTRAPPRGLQITLKSPNGELLDETIVMANLGYFQFKAQPGLWNFAIKEGNSDKVFKLQSIDTIGTSSESSEFLVMADIDGLTIFPKFERKHGMRDVDVLSLPEPREKSKPSIFNQIKEVVFKEDGKHSKKADINIFTVASGHLYERFVYIMILSVLKNTNYSVKFWFIENFLSPSFKSFIPYLSEKLGFQYEMVTYKWPRWLRQQQEKQREIWGYKILFLDVLFPLELDKVIFVDADQIVRTDLKELIDLDLKGKVWAYTPMGDSRKEMEGFRFWKTGFWKDWLRGKPYHISALYLINLRLFRQKAAGDILRGQYQALSQDKNSLANLDQDLPNYIQHQLPIYSLPQEWLWCQTWCSDQSLSRAKTIDLCQNPLTKTPKLERARQISEWTMYDEEISGYTEDFKRELFNINRSVIEADIENLAGAQDGNSFKRKSEKNEKSSSDEIDDTEKSKQNNRDEL